MRLVTMVAVVVVVACGGSSDGGGPGQTERLRLVSTVPVPNGVIARTDDLHFTFSGPVDWHQIQYVSCVSAGCRSPMVPYRFVSTGTEVVGTPLLPAEPGQTYTLRVTPITDDSQAKNIDFTFVAAAAGITITTDVVNDTTLLAPVTYWIDPAVRIRAKLTIPPGSDVAGDLVTAGAGSIEAIGLPTARIRIANGTVSGTARISYVDALNVAGFSVTGDVDHSTVYGGRFLGLAVRIAGSLTDSRVAGMPVRSLTGSVQRNVFIDCELPLGGEVDLTQGTSLSKWDASTQFVNNIMDLSPQAEGRSYSGYGPKVWIQGSEGVVRSNSFIGFDANRIQPLAETSRADLSSNWWGTTDMTAIGVYFAPANYNGVLRENIPTLTPILAASDPATPTH